MVDYIGDYYKSYEGDTTCYSSAHPGLRRPPWHGIEALVPWYLGTLGGTPNRDPESH